MEGRGGYLKLSVELVEGEVCEGGGIALATGPCDLSEDEGRREENRRGACAPKPGKYHCGELRVL